MEITYKNLKVKEKTLTFTIEESKINGIYSNQKEKIIELINLKKKINGKILINQEEIKKDKINPIRRKVEIVKEKTYFQNKVYEIMYYEIRQRELSLKDPKKKIIDSLKIVGLNSNYLNKTLKSLSSSEKKQLLIAIALLSNPEVLFIEEPFKMLDRNNEKKLWMLFQKMKEQYQKTIVFISEDAEILYKYTDQLIIIKNDKVEQEGQTKEIFENVEFFKKHKIELPEIVEFTYLAKKQKEVKIDYHKDIRDIIKDIYKHI